jgi:hypothetical protein
MNFKNAYYRKEYNGNESRTEYYWVSLYLMYIQTSLY